MNLIKRLLFWEIIQGMFLTLSRLLNPRTVVTRRYPYEKRESKPGFRGLHALIRNPKTGLEKCVACGLCAAVCPSQCIALYTAEGPGQQKIAERYEVDTLRCLFCGLCVEACPVGALALTGHFAYAGYDRKAFIYTKEQLLSNWDMYMAGPLGDTYLTNFWQPAARNFKAYAGQPVFRGAAGAAAAKEGN